jgi:hypothetical protein
VRLAGLLGYCGSTRLRQTAIRQIAGRVALTGSGPPSAPVRALLASALRATSVVRPADPRTLIGTSGGWSRRRASR